MQQEKTHQNLLQGVESYDKTALKPTDTVEKIILPDPEGDLFDHLFLRMQFKRVGLTDFFVVFVSYLTQ